MRKQAERKREGEGGKDRKSRNVEADHEHLEGGEEWEQEQEERARETEGAHAWLLPGNCGVELKLNVNTSPFTLSSEQKPQWGCCQLHMPCLNSSILHSVL